MIQKGTIIAIEDDLDDQDIFTDVLQELKVPNPVKFFINGKEALSYLRITKEQPFIIFCDINMPHLNGIEVRKEIASDEELSNKAIPFVFLTTTADKATVSEAFKMNVQGFFTKPSVLEDYKQTLNEILRYWSKCKHPN